MFRRPPVALYRSKGRNRRTAGARAPCEQLCHPAAIVTDAKCICRGPVERDPWTKQRWCWAECPTHRVKNASSNWRGRQWDTVEKNTKQLTSTRRKSRCLATVDPRRDTTEYVVCNKAVDSDAVETDRLRLLTVMLALKLTSSLWQKAQSRDTTTISSLTTFLNRFTTDLVASQQLRPETAKRLQKEWARRIRDQSPATIYRFLLVDLRDTLATITKLKQETPILDFIIDNVHDDDIGDFLRGAQLQFDDDGAFYRLLKSQADAYPRISSHHPDQKTSAHYAVNERLYGALFHVLGGETSGRQSWVQMESSPWPGGLTVADVFWSVFHEPRFIKDIAEHSLDFVVHKLTHRNVGPLGSSTRGEWDPIRLWERLPVGRRANLLDHTRNPLVIADIATTTRPNATVLLPPALPLAVSPFLLQ